MDLSTPDWDGRAWQGVTLVAQAPKKDGYTNRWREHQSRSELVAVVGIQAHIFSRQMSHHLVASDKMDKLLERTR